jgi:hypothetical protein
MRNDHSHVWIEQNGLIVDVTADQFDDVDDPVIVTRDGAWHSEFEPIAGDNHEALIDVYGDGTRIRLRSLYARITVPSTTIDDA